MVYCGECGEQNPDGGKYCWKCGKPLYLGTEVQSSERNQSTEEPPTVAKRAALRKSYTGVSIVVFILYWLFWLPGFVVNILYYKEAKRMEKTAEQSLPGVGCLSFMLYLHLLVVIPIIVIAIFALLGPQIANIFSKVETSAAIATPAPSAYPALATATLFPTLTRAAPPPTATPTGALLMDFFVDNRNGWNTSEGELYFEDSSYHVRNNREGHSSFATCRSCGPFTDFDYIAKIEKIEGPDDYGYGLVFRFTNDEFYAFQVTGNGGYEFIKSQGGQWHIITDFVPSDSIQKGNSLNFLNVICRGSRFEFYINGRLVGSATDETFSSGYVGVGVGASGLHIRVSSVVVYE